MFGDEIKVDKDEDSKIQLGLVGVNHRSAPLHIREKISEAEFIYRKVETDLGLAFEHAVISTCNRTELVFSATKRAFSELTFGISDIFSKILGIDKNDLYLPNSDSSMIYSFSDINAVNHFYKVASGIDSMILGEAEILGQVKNAYKEAVNRGTIRSTLHYLFQSAFRTAKVVRSGTGVGHGTVSIASTAVQAAINIFGNLNDRKVLIIGSGQTGSLISKYFQAAGVSQFFVANRSEVNARKLVSDIKGVFVPLDRLPMVIPSVDIVVSAVNLKKESFLVTKKNLDFLENLDRRNLFCVLDLSVPRSIDPEISNLSSAYYFDVDSLSGLAEQNRLGRESEALRALEIIDSQVTEFSRWQNGQIIHQLVGSVFRHFELISSQEKIKTLKRVGNLSLSTNDLSFLSKNIDRSYLATAKKLFGSLINDFKEGKISEEEFLTTVKCLGISIGS